MTAKQKYMADFKLEVDDVGREITVTADAAQVELQSAQQSGLISGTQVRELSLNNRHFAQLVPCKSNKSISATSASSVQVLITGRGMDLNKRSDSPPMKIRR